VGEIPGAIAWPTACQASTGWDEFPKYFAPQLVHAMSRQLRTKVLFGTDYPYIKMDGGAATSRAWISTRRWCR